MFWHVEPPHCGTVLWASICDHFHTPRLRTVSISIFTSDHQPFIRPYLSIYRMKTLLSKVLTYLTKRSTLTFFSNPSYLDHFTTTDLLLNHPFRFRTRQTCSKCSLRLSYVSVWPRSRRARWSRRGRRGKCGQVCRVMRRGPGAAATLLPYRHSPGGPQPALLKLPR